MRKQAKRAGRTSHTADALPRSTAGMEGTEVYAELVRFQDLTTSLECIPYQDGMTDACRDIIPQSAESQLGLARSHFLDAFADVEAEIIRFLNQAGQFKSGTPFGSRIEAFRKLEGISRIAKANHTKRDKVADEIAALRPVRADIVHSRMQVRLMDNTAYALFVNAQNRHESYPSCRILNLADLETITRKLSEYLMDLNNLGRVNPPSSPQPPLPGAAGDP